MRSGFLLNFELRELVCIWWTGHICSGPGTGTDGLCWRSVDDVTVAVQALQ